ncbi:MAG: hypothetical protein HOV77_15435 [Hamadaea sp.]|uniref:hypothetical protein n=1 Tax=Hamadaea sp. TaxID=2024425 RepID=UPI0017FFF361|nr:hypothetical protein [Hamadaea sp.]NUT20577.1 hypothetical protein [Hamadaea sp.]
MNLLRFALRLDAGASAGLGVVILALSGKLDEWLGTPTAFSLGVGVFLLVWAAGLALLAARSEIAPGAVWTVIVLNVGWIAGSLAIAFGGAFDLTGWGVALSALQALPVLLFIDLEYLGLRRVRRAVGGGAVRSSAA